MKGVMTLTEKFDEYKKRDRIDSDYSDYKEEYAAEVAPQRIDYDYDEKDHKDDVRSSAVAPRGIPMFGLICPIGKPNRTGIAYEVKYSYSIVCND